MYSVGENLLNLTDIQIERTVQVNLLSNFWVRLFANINCLYDCVVYLVFALSFQMPYELQTVKAFLPDMTSRNHGHIVTIASVAGLVGSCKMTDYCASKFGAVGFAESLEYELRAGGFDNVYTTTVCPYIINTGMFDGCQTRLEHYYDHLQAIILRFNVCFVHAQICCRLQISKDSWYIGT